ncbi:MAG: succinylglutamate desuccinylase/aspartoacylase family protein [Spirochaetaceae bacterium]|nr:succinylglutamate desuccinylase/aspartoacylase family protein [Spirochaetaceae bacterium]
MKPLRRRAAPSRLAAALVAALSLASMAIASAALAGCAGLAPRATFPAEARPAAGRAERRMLSNYLPSLAGGPGDSPVYVVEGRKPGGTFFVCAGTHGNEIAGVVSAAILAERAELSAGRLIVLPRANRSAATYPDPERPGPPAILIPTPRGERRFAYGARRTNPADEGRPDPAVYLHPDSSHPQDGAEARNLDRSYPGSPDGGLTARVAFAIQRLLEVEGVAVALDLHEANPESKLAWNIIANPKNVDLAAMAVLLLEEEGLRMAVDASAEEPRGLSHREWGDRTKALAFLVETPNPGQLYPPRTGDPFADPELPLGRRVAAQLAVIRALLAAYNEAAPEGERILLEALPSRAEIEAGGLGALLE